MLLTLYSQEKSRVDFFRRLKAAIPVNFFLIDPLIVSLLASELAFRCRTLISDYLIETDPQEVGPYNTMVLKNPLVLLQRPVSCALVSVHWGK